MNHRETQVVQEEDEIKMLGRYEKLSKIGEGTYGVVYKARHVDKNQIVAIKKIRVLDWPEEGIPSTAIREISILRQIKHENVVPIIEVLFNHKTPTKIYVVFQYLDFDLRAFLKTYKQPCALMMAKVGEVQNQKILWQILQGVKHCHQSRFIHRDIKPQNILINDKGNIKIADFGLARAFGLPMRTLTKQVVTLWYRSPELILGKKQYELGVDIWSVGCIFAELVLGQPLFCGDSEIDQLFKIFRLLGTPDESTWPGVSTFEHFKVKFPKWRPQRLSLRVPQLDTFGLDLLSRMIALRPQERLSAKACLLHPFFDDIRPIVGIKEVIAHE